MSHTLTVKRSELAAKVAETVMGWRRCGELPHWITADGELWAAHENWDPTTNANDTLAVVERLRKLGWDWCVGSDPEGHAAELEKGNPHRFILVKDTKLHVATCLAAIEAVTGKRVVLEDDA